VFVLKVVPLLSDPNLPDRRVKLLDIELRKTAGHLDPKNENPDRVVWITFDKDDPPFQVPEVRVRISSPDKTWALLLADELEPQVSRLFKTKSFPNWIYLLFAPVVALIGYRISIWAGYSMPRPIAHGILAGVGFTGLILFLEVHTRIAEKKFRLMRILASEPTFLWGEEVSNSVDRETLRKNIFWGVIVGFLVSLVAGLVPLLL